MDLKLRKRIKNKSLLLPHFNDGTPFFNGNSFFDIQGNVDNRGVADWYIEPETKPISVTNTPNTTKSTSTSNTTKSLFTSPATNDKIRTPMNQSVPPSRPTSTTNRGVTEFDNSYNPSWNRDVGNKSQADSAASGAGPFFAIGAWLGGGVLEGLDAMRPQEQELTQLAGTTTLSVDGVDYTQYGRLDKDEMVSEYKKHSWKKFLTNPATAITRLIGVDHYRNELIKQNAKLSAISEANRNIASTQALLKKSAAENKNINQGSVFAHAYNGKDGYPMFKYGKVNTPYGLMPGEKNSYVSEGEYIWDGMHSLSRVNRGPNDTAPAFLRGKDVVFTNNPEIPAPAGFKTIAQAVPYAARTGRLGDLAKWQENMHNIGFKNGKNGYPMFYDGGEWVNYITNGIGVAASLGLYLDAMSRKHPNANIYAPNRQGELALSDFDRQYYNNYPIKNEILNVANKYNRSLDFSGLSASQKYMAKVANMNNAYDSIIKSYNDIYNKNIALAQTKAQLRTNLGDANSNREQQGNKYRTDSIFGSLAAQQSGQQMSPKNMMSYLNNAAILSDRYRRYLALKNRYNQDLTADQLKLLKDIITV